MRNQLKTLLSKQEPVSLSLRICGVFGGSIAGIISTALLYVILVLGLHIVGSGIPVLCTFIGVGGTVGGIAGFIYPRQTLEFAWNAICGCIPGI